MAKLRNIGPKSADWLHRVGIHSRSELATVGAVAVYLMVRRAGGRPSLNLLWALEGAVQDIDWRAISDADKNRLLAELADATE